jgi:hypothetical protein
MDKIFIPKGMIEGAEASPVPSVPLTQVGIGLVQWVLIIMSGFIAVIIIGYGLKEYQSTKLLEYCQQELLSDKTEEVKSIRAKELIEKIREDQIEFRKFLKDMVQLILLNALLPVLTALLGYVFGTRQT